jgi:hypothetical protein
MVSKSTERYIMPAQRVQPVNLDFSSAYVQAREQGADLIAQGLRDLPQVDKSPIRVVEVSHDHQGPKGGISSHVLFTLEIDGQLIPVLASVYTGPAIDKQILAAARERERLVKRDEQLREALGVGPSPQRLPAMAGMTHTPDEPGLPPLDGYDDDDEYDEDSDLDD